MAEPVITRAFRRARRRERLKASGFAVGALGGLVAGWLLVALGCFAIAVHYVVRSRLISLPALEADPTMRGLLQAAGSRAKPPVLPPATIVK